MQTPRTPGQRAGLTHAAVLDAAHSILAEQGIEALTMRGLAARLAVAPNSLYSHVANKDTLVDDLLDDVLAEVQEPAADIEDPVSGLQRLMASTYDVLLDHPDLVPLYLARQGARGANARRLGETMTTLLARGKVTGAPAEDALRVLIVYTIGFAAFATHPPTETGDGQPLSADDLLDNFTKGLQWMLSGIVQISTRT